MYHFGTCKADKKRADDVLLANMYRVINLKTRWKWLRKFRRHRAKIYHLAVVKCGDKHFKVKEVNDGTVI
jgi:hypothetical protein